MVAHRGRTFLSPVRPPAGTNDSLVACGGTLVLAAVGMLVAGWLGGASYCLGSVNTRMRPLFGPVPEPGPLEILLTLVVGLGLPLVIAGLLGKLVLDRWRGRRPLYDPSVEDAPVSGKWWWIIAAQPLGYLLLFVMALAYAFLPIPFMSLFPVSYVLIVLLWLFAFVGPVAVYFDRKYVAAVSDWSPSLAYYLVVLPTAGLLLATIYVYERHEHLGVP